MSDNRLTCAEVVQQLFTYLDQELDAATSAQIDRHLGTCRECCSRLKFEKRLRVKLQESATEKAPARLYGRVREMLDQD